MRCMCDEDSVSERRGPRILEKTDGKLIIAHVEVNKNNTLVPNACDETLPSESQCGNSIKNSLKCLSASAQLQRRGAQLRAAVLTNW